MDRKDARFDLPAAQKGLDHPFTSYYETVPVDIDTCYQVRNLVIFVRQTISELQVFQHPDPTVTNTLSYLHQKASELEGIVLRSGINITFPSPPTVFNSEQYSHLYLPRHASSPSSAATTPDSSPPVELRSEASGLRNFNDPSLNSTSSSPFPPFVSSLPQYYKQASQSATYEKEFAANNEYENNFSNIQNLSIHFPSQDYSSLSHHDNEDQYVAKYARNEQGRSQIFNSECNRRGRKMRTKTSPKTRSLMCKSCGDTQSCEWRRGPDGSKSLCNACGIHYAKIVKREEKTAKTYKMKSEFGLNDLLNSANPEDREDLMNETSSDSIPDERGKAKIKKEGENEKNEKE